MKKFEYTSYDINNFKRVGIEYAENEAELCDILYKKGEYIKSSKTAFFSLDSTIKLKSRELSDFCNQLGLMLQSGLAIKKALEVVIDTSICRKEVKKVYVKILDKVTEGCSLSSAMREVNIFPELLLSMVQSSEENATLDKVLIQMSDYFERDVKIGNKIKGAMIYPIALLCIMIGVILLVFNVILPTFITTLEKMTELPMITKIVIGISDVITQNGILIVISSVLFLVLFSAISQKDSVKFYIDKVKLKLPYVGGLLQNIYTYRFASTLSSMYLGGISILNAIKMSSLTVNNLYLQKQLELVYNNLTRGVSLSLALTDVEGFHKKLSSSIKVGEETGELDNLLLKLSRNLEEDANASIDRLLILLEPVTIVLLGALILPLVLAIMLPMFKMYSSIGVGM